MTRFRPAPRSRQRESLSRALWRSWLSLPTWLLPPGGGSGGGPAPPQKSPAARKHQGRGPLNSCQFLLFLAALGLGLFLFLVPRVSPHGDPHDGPLAFPANGSVTHAQGGRDHPSPADVDRLCMPDLTGFPSWTGSQNRSATESDVYPDAACEDYFGNGYKEVHSVFGTPPNNSVQAFKSTDSKAELACLQALHPDTSFRASWTPTDRSQRQAVSRSLNFKEGAGEPSPSSYSGAELSGGGWLRCRKNRALGASICDAFHVAVHPGHVNASRGSVMDQISGPRRQRMLWETLPYFSRGAVQVAVGSVDFPRSIPEDGVRFLFPRNDRVEWRNLWNSIQGVSTISCQQVVNHPTLFVIRYEFRNLYHTLTDWYNAYVATRVNELRVRPNVLFLDGHPQGPLDNVWGHLFGNHTQIKDYPTDGALCFRHGIFVQLGYHSPLFSAFLAKGDAVRQCVGCSAANSSESALGKVTTEFSPLDAGGPKITGRIAEFGAFVLKSFNMLPEGRGTSPDSEQDCGSGSEWLRTGRGPVRILFVRRDSVCSGGSTGDQDCQPAKPRLYDQEGLVRSLVDWAWQRAREAKALGAFRRQQGGAWARSRSREDRGQSVFFKGAAVATAEEAGGELGSAGRAIKEAEAEVAREAGVELVGGLDAAAAAGAPRLLVVVNASLAKWSFEEQLKAVQWADVMVGAHGAGLAHVVFMRPGTAVVELRKSVGTQDYYQLLSRQRGVRSVRVTTEGAESLKRTLLWLIGEGIT